MESRFGHDFSQVRVHADTRAAEAASAIDARAFTMSRDIVFGTGEYAPQTESGRRLLSHELTHVLQQRTGVPLQAGIGQAGNEHERQADSVANEMIQSPRGNFDAFARSTIAQNIGSGRSGLALLGRSIAGEEAFMANNSGRNAIGSSYAIQRQSKGDDPKGGKKDDGKIEKIRQRIQTVFYDMSFFKKTWSVYNPDRHTLSNDQEESLKAWKDHPSNNVEQDSDLTNDFYQFLEHYYSTFKADPKFNPEASKKGDVLRELQMHLDAKSKKNPNYMEMWDKYDQKKLNQKQEAFLKDLQDAGFSAGDFFYLQEVGRIR